MTTMIAEVYDVFISAGADEGKARRAAEVLTDFDGHFEQSDRRFDTVDKKFDRVDKRFDEIDKRFGEVDTQLAAVDDGWMM